MVYSPHSLIRGVWICVAKTLKLRLIHWVQDSGIYSCQFRFFYREVLVEVLCVEGMFLKEQISIITYTA